MEKLNPTHAFAVPFALDSDLNDLENIVQFNIDFKPDSTLDNLLDFCDEYTNKRINVHFADTVDFKVLKSIRRVYKNLYVRLDKRQFKEVPDLKENDIPFFFGISFPAVNWCSLSDLITLGVTDVYLADDLCYDMKAAHDYCAAHNVNTRIILNKIPMSTPLGAFDIKSPIWMPRDIDKLSEYVDIFEFECSKYPDAAELDVFYRVWTQQKRWHGNLQEINDDLEIEVNDDYMLPYASIKKMNCGRRCNKRAVNSCDLCGKTLELSDIFQSKGTRILY